MIQNEKRKSRSIPLMDFYEILQLEFLSYYFRMLIYDQNFRSKYIDFCEKKKESILGLSLKRNLPNIFKDEKFKQKYLDKFFVNDGYGLPNFKYRDAHQTKHLGYWDKKSYFSKDVLVFYKNEEYCIVKNMCDFEDDNRSFVVIKKGSYPTLKVRISEVKRIWDFNCFNFDLL